MNFCRTTLIFFFVFLAKLSSAQSDLLQNVPVDTLKQDDSSTVFIAGITIYGNKKTRDFIINREIPFKQGDYVLARELDKKLRIAKEQLFNTTLFLSVSVTVANRYGQFVFISIDVKERWYIFPLPYFSLVDRNLNTWLVTYHHSFQRVNYGIKFLHTNFTGRNDHLTLWFITGYSRQISLKYNRPFFDKKLRNGYTVSFNYTRQRELNYGTSLSKEKFFKPDSLFLRKAISAEFDYIFRPGLRTRHIFSIGYTRETIADTVLTYNPDYFSNSKTKVQFPLIGYTLQYFHADYNAYPTKGFLGSAELLYRGFTYTIPIFHNTQVQFKEGATVSLPFNQPFYNKRIFGYGGIFVRGLEYYVIDGVAGFVGRTTLQHKLLQFNLKLAPGKKYEQNIPFKFYGTLNSDVAYVYDKKPGNSLLNNKMIYTWGLGLDMISFYDVVFKFDYSFNQLGKSGLFVHVRTDF